MGSPGAVPFLLEPTISTSTKTHNNTHARSPLLPLRARNQRVADYYRYVPPTYLTTVLLYTVCCVYTEVPIRSRHTVVITNKRPGDPKPKGQRPSRVSCSSINSSSRMLCMLQGELAAFAAKISPRICFGYMDLAAGRFYRIRLEGQRYRYR